MKKSAELKWVVLVILIALGLALHKYGNELPDEADIASAWAKYKPEENPLFDASMMSDLKCNKAGNQAVYCNYVMGGLTHSDVLQKKDGEWELLMLNKKDESDL